jgi:type VI protein secretion system component VasK
MRTKPPSRSMTWVSVTGAATLTVLGIITGTLGLRLWADSFPAASYYGILAGVWLLYGVMADAAWRARLDYWKAKQESEKAAAEVARLDAEIEELLRTEGRRRRKERGEQ